MLLLQVSSSGFDHRVCKSAAACVVHSFLYPLTGGYRPSHAIRPSRTGRVGSAAQIAKEDSFSFTPHFYWKATLRRFVCTMYIVLGGWRTRGAKSRARARAVLRRRQAKEFSLSMSLRSGALRSISLGFCDFVSTCADLQRWRLNAPRYNEGGRGGLA